MNDRPWTIKRVRELLDSAPERVRELEPTFFAWIENEARGMDVGPKRFDPATLGPLLELKLKRHED